MDNWTKRMLEEGFTYQVLTNAAALGNTPEEIAEKAVAISKAAVTLLARDEESAMRKDDEKNAASEVK